MPEEKKALVSYIVTRYEDGSVDVEDAKKEGTTELTPSQIFDDIEDLYKVIQNKRAENAAYVGALRALAVFLKDKE